MSIFGWQDTLNSKELHRKRLRCATNKRSFHENYQTTLPSPTTQETPFPPIISLKDLNENTTTKKKAWSKTNINITHTYHTTTHPKKQSSLLEIPNDPNNMKRIIWRGCDFACTWREIELHHPVSTIDYKPYQPSCRKIQDIDKAPYFEPLWMARSR